MALILPKLKDITNFVLKLICSLFNPLSVTSFWSHWDKAFREALKEKKTVNFKDIVIKGG